MPGQPYGIRSEKSGAFVPKLGEVLPTIAGEKVRKVLNKLPDGKSKGYDSWAPNELRALTKARLDALADILNDCEEQGRWPIGRWGDPSLPSSQRNELKTKEG